MNCSWQESHRLRVTRRRTRISALATLAMLLVGCLGSSGPTVQVSIGEDGFWSVDPESQITTSESFRLSIENRTKETKEYVVVALFGGAPNALPVRDGVLDVSRSGIDFDVDAPGVATFGVAYSKVGVQGEGGAGFEPAVIEPGESQKVTIGDPLKGGGGSGEYVVLSFLPGQYERGEYVAFTLTDPEGSVPSAFAPSPLGDSALRIGQTLPAWNGLTLDGDIFDSSQLNGSKALIIVLTDGHDLAAEALDTFSSLFDDFSDEIGFVVVDTFPDPNPDRLVELIDDAEITSPVVYDSTGELAELAKPDGSGIYWIFTNEEGAVTAVETGIPVKEELAVHFDEG